jgi:hypothetical protein
MLSSIKACKTRTVLTEEQVIQIFKIKLANMKAGTRVQDKVSAASLAKVYLVGEKTIRDIWTGRTWFRELMHLDPARASMLERLKLPGRPKGSKDKKSRQEFIIGTFREQLPSFAAFGPKAPVPDAALHHCAAHKSWTANYIQHESPPQLYQQMLTSEFPNDKLQGCPMRQPTLHAPTAAHSLSRHAPAAARSLSGVHGAPFPASWPAAASITASTSPLHWQHASIEEAVAPLPVSSRADDPFHDDWRYWPREARDPPALPCESALRSESVLRCRICPSRWEP